MNKKSIIIISILSLIIIGLICAIIYINNYYKKQPDYIFYTTAEDATLEGRWTSTRDSLIKVIKDYKDGQPVYANENVVEYWLDLKKDGKYILYFNDVAEQSRSNYNIEKNLIERGKYNIDSNNKIYFDSDDKNLPSSSANYIWNCEVESENLHNCTNYAYEFLKQASE